MCPKYKCPVCNFKGLFEPAYDPDGYGTYEICICCGFEFGFDDDGYKTKEEAYTTWRIKWKEGGCKWFSEYNIEFKPADWNPNKQLEVFEKNSKLS